MNDAPLLELRDIHKRFGGVVALGGVSLTLGRGEVLALVGENGAGKSTLMKVLGGVRRPDAGQILFDGRPVEIRGVNDATRLGVAFVHQELSLLDNLDVAGNVYLGREPRRLGLLDRADMARRVQPHLDRLGLGVTGRTPLRDLSLAQRQMVEIARALSLDARVIIMDEPTSSLTAGETDRLLTTVAELRRGGVSVIYVSHRLGEIERVADRATVLRDGQNAGELGGSGGGAITRDDMVRLMVGRGIKSPAAGRADGGEAGPVAVRLRGLRTAAHPRHAIDLDLRRGEILGLAGLVGAGRSELANAVFGVVPAVGGAVEIDGEVRPIRTAKAGVRAGIYLVPEDRRKSGLVGGMSVRHNITLPALSRLSKLGLLRRGREVRVSERLCALLRVKTAGVEAQVLDLSGGNQQKVVFAKWLARERSPTLMIFDEPTRGVDVGAKAEIYAIMRDLAARGAAVLMVSSDMEEVLGVSDRVAVMHEGRLAGVLGPGQMTERAVMRLAVGDEG